MNEAAPTNNKKMPNFEKAIKTQLSDFLNTQEVQDIQEGHVGGIFPLVKLIEITTSLFTSVPSFKFTAPSKPMLIKDIKELFISREGEHKIFIGPSEDNFATLEILNSNTHIDHVFLTEDEREKCAINPACVPNLNNLPKHIKNWQLASSNDKIDFHMRELDGSHNSNYGFFNLDLQKPEVLVHLKNISEINLPILLEIASQQIASVLGESDKSPVFQSIKIINPSNRISFPIIQGNNSQCDFRVQKSGKRDFDLELGFNMGGEKFVAEIQATQLPNSIIDRMLK